MVLSSPAEYKEFFNDKVILLTGSTGNLGTCILHKLVTELKPRKVFAIVRKSRDQAIQKLESNIPGQRRIFSRSDMLHYVVGDALLPGWGIEDSIRRQLVDQVNIVIHTAAVLSLMDPIGECVANNVEPALELARIASHFAHLQRYVYVSSAYANSFLPDGPVLEQVYPIHDSNDEDIEIEPEWEEIKRTQHSSLTQRFAWPYAFSKYLTERLLLSRYPLLPLLIVRPSTIGPAYRSPFPYFGNEASLPIQGCCKIYLRDPQANKVWHKPCGAAGGSNILDEIPVDFVADTLLLHIAAGTHGIIHASARNYVQLRANQGLLALTHHSRSGATAELGITWIDPTDGPQCALANLFVVGNRNWDFSCLRSEVFKGLKLGSMRLGLTENEVVTFNHRRYELMMEEIRDEQSET